MNDNTVDWDACLKIIQEIEDMTLDFGKRLGIPTIQGNEEANSELSRRIREHLRRGTKP